MTTINRKFKKTRSAYSNHFHYRNKALSESLCYGGLRGYFHLGSPAPEAITFVLTTIKPKDDLNWYELRRRPYDTATWGFSDLHDSGTNYPSPWSGSVDVLLSRAFGHKRVYLSCYVE